MLNKSKKTVKFITYDGILEPIGNSQVLSYLIKVSSEYNIKLLSYEKKEDLVNKIEIRQLKKKLLEHHIEWKYFIYYDHIFFLGTLRNIFNGFFNNIYDLITNKINLFHIRGPLPGLLIIPFLIIYKVKFIFDMRGFWADEKVDRLGWKINSIVYKFFKRVEKILLNSSKHIITLTNDAKQILIDDYKINETKITILPTCVDTDFYKLQRIPINEYINFCHLGSVQSAYNIEKTLKLFSSFLDINKNLKIYFYLNNNEIKKINKIISKFNISKKNYSISSLEKNEVPENLANMSIGIFYCNTNFSIKGSFPTKIGELLSCGVPLICNDFNKHITDFINHNKIGIISDFNSVNYKIIFEDLNKLLRKNKIREKCNQVAINNLSLSYGSKIIANIYKKII